MSDVPDLPEDDAPYVPATPGALLRATREGHGLSIDDVAGQLKLAPRQVQALEDDDYGKLPGRTFVRGFVRNYARYLGLDAEALVAQLPDGNVSPALERPTLASSGRPMGELRTATTTRRRAAPVLIPLVLVAFVAAAVYYEYRREQAETKSPDAATAPARGADAVPGAPTTLPNPLAGGSPQGETGTTSTATTATAPAGSATSPPGTSPTATEAPAGQPGAPGAAGTPATTAPGGAAPGAGTGSPPGTAPTAGAAAPAPADMLVLSFRGSSWAQVKDGSGATLLSTTGQAGSTQAVSGTPPLEVTIGNAANVAVTYRGKPVDLAPFSRGNVARFALK